MRPAVGVLIDASDLDVVARFLGDAIRRSQARGTPAPAQVVALVELCDAFRRARNTGGIPTVETSAPGRDDGRSVAEVADALGITPRAVRGLCARGTIPARKTAGGHWRIE